jgi:hypothetical protein
LLVDKKKHGTKGGTSASGGGNKEILKAKKQVKDRERDIILLNEKL